MTARLFPIPRRLPGSMVRGTCWPAILALVVLAHPLHAEITFLGQWGSNGSGDGQFSFPSGVTTANSGLVYVADAGNSRVQIFDPSGVYNGKWTGISPGILYGIASTSGGDIYTANYYQINEYNSGGGLFNSFETNGVIGGAVGLSVAANGNVYVANSSDQTIQEFTSAGVPVTSWPSQANYPTGVAIGPAGDVYIVGSAGKVVEFSSAGVFETSWNVPNPVGIAIPQTGDVYVADGTSNLIRKFDSVGNSLGTFGAGKFTALVGVTVAPTGRVYGVDNAAGHVVQYFDSAAWTSGTNTFGVAAVGPGELLGSSLDLTPSKSLFVGTLNVNSSGNLQVNGGTLAATTLALNSSSASVQINSGVTSIGTLNVNAGTLLLGSNQSLTVNSTTIGQFGAMGVNGGTFSSTGGITIDGQLAGSGTVAAPLNVHSTGNIITSDGGTLTFTNVGTVTNAGLIDAYGNAPNVSQIEFSGIVNNLSGAQMVGYGSSVLKFDSQLSNDGTLYLSGTSHVYGAITNNPGSSTHIDVNTNAVLHGDVFQNGPIVVEPTGNLTFAAGFRGTGSSSGGGHITFQGQVNPGGVGPAYLVLSNDVSFDPASEYYVRLGSAGSYSTLDIRGTTALSGSLTVALVGGFQPALANEFTVLASTGTRTGDFSTYSGMAVGNHLTLRHAFDLTGHALILTARPTQDGDINLDGVVNGLDIAAVASHWLYSTINGPAGQYVFGDVNGDKVVNGLDIALIASNWLHHENSSASAAAVPEPATWSLALGALPLAWITRRRFRRSRPEKM